MRSLLLFGLVLLATPGFAQASKEGLARSTAAPKATVSNGPVTQAEARSTAKRMEGSLRDILSIKTFPPTQLVAASKPVTREMVVADFARLYQAVRPTVKLTPVPVKFSESRFRVSAKLKPELSRLVKLGFVAPYGPLATSKKATLSVAEYGDAVGFFLSRVAEVTHMPSRKWTPALQGND